MKIPKISLFIFLLCAAPLLGKEVPAANLPMKQLVETKAILSLIDDSAVLKRVLSDYSKSASITIICTEWNQDGARYLVPPSSQMLGLGEMSSEDGDYIQIYTSGTGRISVKQSGKSKTVEAFYFVMSFDRYDTKGILLIPFWADLDRADPESPKIKKWGVLEDRVAYTEEREQDSGGNG